MKCPFLPTFTITLFLLCGCGSLGNILAQDATNLRIHRAVRINQQVEIDGTFTEASWNIHLWSSGFTEKGQKIDERNDTQFKITYDESHLYVAIKCLDPHPDSIPLFPSPRDNPSNDWVEVDFDSNDDGETAYAFAVSPYGVRTDMFISGDDADFDDRWHPEWEVKTSIQENGWNAEMKIPFAQLIIGDNEFWGLQITRRVKRSELYTNWQPMPKGTAGWVSQFGQLHGIEDVQGKEHHSLEYNPSKKYETFQLRHDFSLFTSTLESIYPDLYEFVDKPSFDSLFHAVYQSLNEPLTEFEFYERLTPIMNKIGDGHSWLRPSSRYVRHLVEHSSMLPIGVKIVGNSVFITKDFGANGSLTKGMEILSINDEDIHEILSKLRSYISADGYNVSWKTDRISNNFSYYLSYLFGKQESFKLKVQSPYLNKTEFITISGLTEDNWNKNSLPEAPLTYRKGNWNYQTFDNQVAYLSLATFARGQQFRNYIDQIFEKIGEDSIGSLIIDLRDNYGGNDINGKYLYTYLAREPFYYYKEYEVSSVLDATIIKDIDCCISLEEFDFLKVTSSIGEDKRRLIDDFQQTGYDNPNEMMSPTRNAFQGKVYLIVNGGSFSVTSDFASKFHEMKRGVIIGEETGGGYYGNTSGIDKLLLLPHTNVRVNLNLIKYVNNRELSTHPFGRGVIPDINIEPTGVQISKGVDVELEWVLNFIENKKN
ncbi:MAG: S41 family peptidase [Bacteroidota bacterium]